LTLLRQALGTALLALSASIAPVLADTTLRPVSDFDSIADPAERAKALFGEAAKVFTHPRCLNCHPVGDRPSQTDAMRAPPAMALRGFPAPPAITRRISIRRVFLALRIGASHRFPPAGRVFRRARSASR
jgi:hypothetical protein